MATTVRRVAFTREVEQAFQDGLPLAEVLESVKTMRKELILRLRTKLAKPDRRQIMCLQTLLKEQQDVAASLVAAGSGAAAVWEGEARFYSMPDGTIEVRCASAKTLLGHHFPSNDMLVVTELTRECRRLYLKAMTTGKVLLARGPAGTGKTETCKDTARMLGRDGIVFNCSDAPSPNAAEFAEAVALAKASAPHTPIILDEANRLPVAEIDSMILAAKESDTFLCMTYNPGYAGRSEFPEWVKSQSLQVDMTVPDFALILSVMLGAEGFVECDDLGGQLKSFLEAAQGASSKQDHYDFGLRFMKSAVKMAGAAAREEGFADEKVLLAKTVLDALWMRSTMADKEVLKGLVVEHFGSDPQLAEKLQPAGWPTIGAMVALALKMRHCAMVLPVKPEDEAACLAAIGEEATKAEAELLRVSGTMTEAELFGECKGGDWIDGALSEALRFAATCGKAMWLTIACGMGEGIVDKFKPLNTLMDDNKVLCLATGEKIPLLPHTRVIFLAQTAMHCSPAFISRLGLVYADPHGCSSARVPAAEGSEELEKVVKVDFGGDIRRLHLRASTPTAWMVELRQAIAGAYGLSPDCRLSLRYRDDEGDLCTLVEATLRDALALSSASALRLTVSVE